MSRGAVSLHAADRGEETVRERREAVPSGSSVPASTAKISEGTSTRDPRKSTATTTQPAITMPPRLSALSAQLQRLSLQISSPLSFLLPQLQQQSRNAHILASLSDNPGAYNKRIRRGRGPASGKGKTSGRGHKGQKQHGKVPAGFNGGQTPDHIVHGERGFKNMYVEMLRFLSWNHVFLFCL